MVKFKLVFLAHLIPIGMISKKFQNKPVKGIHGGLSSDLSRSLKHTTHNKLAKVPYFRPKFHIGGKSMQSFKIYYLPLITMEFSFTILQNGHMVDYGWFHPGLAEIPAPVGSQDVMSQLRDYPSRH